MKVIKRTFLTAAVTLFAAVLCLLLTGIVLAACSEKVTLRFVTNGGTALESVEGAVGTAYRIPSDPEKEGYFFDGWYLQSDFSGERQELPQKMPSQSTTYYAKYVPYSILTLNADGGTLSVTEHHIRPNTDLSDYLKDFIPEKEGLEFGGWMTEEAMLSSGALMPEGNLTLTARYKAKYEVNVYVQNPDAPETFEKSIEWSSSGADWEGTMLSPALPDSGHIYLDPEREINMERLLCAGENVLEYYYLRKEVSLSYSVTMQDGNVRKLSQNLLYGAQVPLWEGPDGAEGYVLYGWSEKEQSPAKYMPGERVTLEADDTLLYGTWAQKYTDAKKGGTIVVEEISEDGKHSARYISKDGACEIGIYHDESRFFEAEHRRGRLDEKGYFLPDDSGVYQGYSLAVNEADGEQFGTLSLDFSQGTAEYVTGGEARKGTYDYQFDNAINQYTGIYRFAGESGEIFLFVLDEDKMTFCREGTEKGEYTRMVRKDVLDFERISLDGFGGAVFSENGSSIRGRYRGAGAEGEWIFESSQESFIFLVGMQNFAVGSAVIPGQKVYLRRYEELSGTYRGAGTLILDGYGICGTYISPNGQKTEAHFMREGAFILFEGTQKLRFTLQGSSFSLTGDEAGEYEGEKGTLFLDGGGQAQLHCDGKTISGTYVRGEDREFTFRSSETGQIRFKLFGNEYRVYKPSLFGYFKSRYDETLSLDGFNSGFYTSDEGVTIPVTVGYYDEEFLELFSPNWKKPHYFKLYSGTELSLLSGRSAGVYHIYINGNSGGALLILDENESARLRIGDTFLSGAYRELSKNEIRFSADGKVYRYRLTEKNGEAAAIEFEGDGTFSGEGGTLTIDGFETAVFTSDTGGVSEGRYCLFDGGAELYLTEGLWRFTISGTTLKGAAYYEAFAGEKGMLYLEKSGTSALLRGETFENGTYSTVQSGGKTYNLFEGGDRFSFKLQEGIYRIYDETKEGVYQSADGGKLTLDGCGGGIFSRGEIRTEGEVEYGQNGLILFRSENLETKKGVLAFRVSGEGALEILGAEYGQYVCGQETLYLDGGGKAEYQGVEGEYIALNEASGEYMFTGGGIQFGFRIHDSEFERSSEALSKLTGNYETELGMLQITKYGARLQKSEQEPETLFVCHASEGILFAEDETGALWAFRIEGDTVLVSSAVQKFESSVK